MPLFPGGTDALWAYLSSNLRYPTVAQENGIQGRVIVKFVIRKDGSVTDVTVVRSVDPLLDAAALKVTQEMPNWLPGKQRGKVVNVSYTLPISFNLLDPAKNYCKE